MNEKVRTYLIEAARQKGKFVYYSEMVNDCGLGFDLGSDEGQLQLKQTLTDISRYEHAQDRPMLSSIAVGKKDKDHGNGFYDLAEEFGFGKNKVLHDQYWGMKEATKTREFWTNNSHYKMYAKITNTKTLSTISGLFDLLLSEERYKWTEKWKNDYVDFIKDVQKLQNAIQANPNIEIDNGLLYSTLSPGIQNYEDFMLKWLRVKDNGVSSRGQSVLAEHHFDVIVWDDTFKILAKQAISNPTVNSFNAFRKWWFDNSNITNRPLLINRAFAACKPETLSSAVDNEKFWITISILKARYNFDFENDPKDNWFLANEQLTKWLDSELIKSLSKWTNRLEQLVWRNIFVWLIFDYFKSGEILPPNKLIKKEKPKGGLTSAPEHSGEFKDYDTDFEEKTRQQKDLGDAGEELVKQYEIEYLKSKGLIEKSKEVKVVPDGRGYDVLSFDESGIDKYIEVKTTTGKDLTPFYLSENEIEYMKRHKSSYVIYRVYNYDEENNSGEFFEIDGDVEAQLILKPIQFRVFMKKEK